MISEFHFSVLYNIHAQKFLILYIPYTSESAYFELLSRISNLSERCRRLNQSKSTRLDMFNSTIILKQRPLRSLATAAQVFAPHSRSPLVVRAAEWDPEGLFGKKAPQEGIIERRMMQKRIETDKEFKKQMEEFAAKKREELIAKREARALPTRMEDLVEYFLDTEAPEMEFEVARCRPMLEKPFFAHLDKVIGIERFATVPNEDRLAELETLRDYIKEAVEAIDKAAASVSAPADRLKKLLVSKDKKQTILDMAGNNEIDIGLIELLEQNIGGAQASGQKEAAEFMTKILQACKRYVIT